MSFIAVVALAGCLYLGRALLREKDKHAAFVEAVVVRLEVLMRRFVDLEEEKRRSRRGRSAPDSREVTGSHAALPKSGAAPSGGDSEAA